jgi:hypothetical protein
MKMNEISRLLLFVALVLAIPGLLNRVVPLKAHFDSRPIARLRAMPSNVILIGDSMLDNGVDADLLGQRLGGRHVALLWHGGAASAMWYFTLKNYIVASGVHPDLVCILFRDRLLTDANFRARGTGLKQIEAAMHEDEPVYRLVLGNDSAGNRDLERWVTDIYPLNARRYAFQAKIEQVLFRALSMTGIKPSKLERRVNETFATSNLRVEATEEATALNEAKELEFDPDPRHSFLPHIVDVAAQAHIPLCFLRVKRHPSADGHVVQSEQLRRYIADLRAWLEGHGCFFIDDTDNPERTEDMYVRAGNDHMGPWARRRSTELYGNKLRPILP